MNNNLDMNPQSVPHDSRPDPKLVFNAEAFRGRRYLITGGSRGIGEATVRMLLGLGASVAALARDPVQLQRLNDELGSSHDLLVISADVGDGNALREAVAQCHQRWHGRLDGLVNNAMLNASGSLEQLPDERFLAAWQVNTLAAWRLAKACLPLLTAAGGGSIVNVSSVMAHLTVPANHAYASSKGALEALTRSLAVELAPKRIRVNTMLPGYIRTYEGHPGRDLPRSSWTARMKLEAKYIERLTEVGQPWPMHGRPEDAASSIVYLLSDAAAFITGTTLAVDGGQMVDFCGLHDPHRLQVAKELADLQNAIAAADAHDSKAHK